MKQIYRPVLDVSILGLVLFHALGCHPGKPPQTVIPNGVGDKKTGSYQQVTGEDPENNKDRWNKIFDTANYVFGKEPAAFLKENSRFLIAGGKALDIAMSEGRNAVYVAKKGMQVDGVDNSDVALRKAALLARENRVRMNIINADLNGYQIKPEDYDVILNFYYLQRNLVPQIKRGLKRGGIVFFENNTIDQLKNPGGEKNRDYLLQKGELKSMFKDFEILVYRETNDGENAIASLIARKPR